MLSKQDDWIRLIIQLLVQWQLFVQ